MEINTKDHLEIFVDEESVILKKHEPACLFCGNTNNMKHYGNRIVCQECIDKLAKE